MFGEFILLFLLILGSVFVSPVSGNPARGVLKPKSTMTIAKDSLIYVDELKYSPTYYAGLGLLYTGILVGIYDIYTRLHNR